MNDNNQKKPIANNSSTKKSANKKNKTTSRKLDLYLLKRLGSYLKTRKLLLSVIVLLMLLANLANVSHPYLFKTGIDEYIAKGNFTGLKLIAFFLGLTMLTNFVLSIGYSYLIQHLGHHLVKNIRIDIAKKVLSLSRSYFDRTPIGQSLTLLTNDVESIREFIASGMASILANFITIIFLFSVMYYISPQLTALVALSVPLFAAATWGFKVALRSGYRGVRSSNAAMNVQLLESITGMKEILLFNHRTKSINDFKVANRNYLRSFMKIVQSYSLYFPVIEGLTALTMIVIIFISYNYFAQAPSFGNLFAFFIYINMLFRPLRDLAEQFNTLQSALSGAERIFSFLDKKNNLHLEFSAPTQLLKSAQPSIHTPEKLSGDIEFKNVHFSYNEESPVLKGLSFSISEGEKIAVVGSTGAGKTTVVSLLTRLYEITSGEILIGGKSIRDIPLQTLRHNISTIPQDVFLFSGTFRENVLLGHERSEELLQTASKQALINDIIAKRKHGFNSTVLEEGKSLSTGQKQLLSFARAFVKNAPIVILDEATANIDSQSERKIEKALERLTKERTSIIIAHRLSTIRNADRILVLHQGKLQETGTHDELIANGGFYNKLYSMQQIQLQAG